MFITSSLTDEWSKRHFYSNCLQFVLNSGSQWSCLALYIKLLWTTTVCLSCFAYVFSASFLLPDGLKTIQQSNCVEEIGKFIMCRVIFLKISQYRSNPLTLAVWDNTPSHWDSIIFQEWPVGTIRVSTETSNTEIPSDNMLHLLFDRQFYTNTLTASWERTLLVWIAPRGAELSSKITWPMKPRHDGG